MSSLFRDDSIEDIIKAPKVNTQVGPESGDVVSFQSGKNEFSMGECVGVVSGAVLVQPYAVDSKVLEGEGVVVQYKGVKQ